MCRIQEEFSICSRRARSRGLLLLQEFCARQQVDASRPQTRDRRIRIIEAKDKGCFFSAPKGKAYIYSMLRLILQRPQGPEPEPPGRSGTSTASTSVALTEKPCVFEDLSWPAASPRQSSAEFRICGRRPGTRRGCSLPRRPAHGRGQNVARCVFDKDRKLSDLHDCRRSMTRLAFPSLRWMVRGSTRVIRTRTCNTRSMAWASFRSIASNPLTVSVNNCGVTSTWTSI